MNIRTAIPRMHAFEVIWNPGNHDQLTAARIHAYQRAIAVTGATAGSRWSTGSREGGIEIGHRIYMFKVGTQGRGLIASGHATSVVEEDEHWDDNKPGQLANYVHIAWDAFVDPDSFLPWSDIRAADPSFPDRFQGGGQRIEDSKASTLEVLWRQHLHGLGQRPGGAGGVPARYAYGLAKRRLHQRDFRALLLDHYEPKCWICGFNEIALLEAAHIVPDAECGESTVTNGRLMCPNHHKAHDTGLFALDENDVPIWTKGAQPFGAPQRCEVWVEEETISAI